MQFSKMAKHLLYERGANYRPRSDDADWLIGENNREFTPGQLVSLAKAYDRERLRAYDALVKAHVVLDGQPLKPSLRDT